MEIPDSWKIVKFVSPEYGVVYKLLAGWYGGYAYGDAWRLNSGIESVTESNTHYDFIGTSGSNYHCAKINEHVNNIMGGMVSSWQEQAKKLDGTTISLVDYKDYVNELS